MPSIEVRTTITEYGPAAAILLDDAQTTALTSAKTPPVVVTIADRSARLRVSRMGGCAAIGLSKAARAQLGVEIGDEVDATIALDEAERTVEVPEDLAAVLAADPAAKERFEALSYTRQKEITRGIAEAKRAETRDRRLAKALEDLASGQHPSTLEG